MNIKTSFIPRQPGMSAWYSCLKCGNIFWAKVPFFSLTGGSLEKKCPHCGGSPVLQDDRVKY